MKYYLDCEFDGPELLSLAIVAEDGRELYMATHHRSANDEWVQENVCPIIDLEGAKPEPLTDAGEKIAMLLHRDDSPEFVADWPTDFQFLLPMLHDDMGNMIDIPSFKCLIERVDAYPTSLKGAVQHNALWDARALKHKLAA